MGGRDLPVDGRVLETAAREAPGRVALACLFGWLLPGAGHWCLGRRARGAVFFCLVSTSLLLGAVLHGRFSVLDKRQPILSALQVVACLGSGPMEIVARTLVYGAPVYRMPEEDTAYPGEIRRPTSHVGRTLQARNETFNSAYGTAYLWLAGLMNLLLILDVFDIGVGRKP